LQPAHPHQNPEPAAGTQPQPIPGAFNPPVPPKARAHALQPQRIPAPPTVLSSSPTAATIFAAFRRRWFLAISLGLLVGACVAVVLWLVTPQTYTARAFLRVQSVYPFILTQTPDTITEFNIYKQDQMFLVKTRGVLNSALNDPNVIANLSDPNNPVVKNEIDLVAWLNKEVIVDGASPQIIRIAMVGNDSKRITLLVEAIRDAYLREQIENEHLRRVRRLDDLKNIHDKKELALKAKRDSLKDLAADLGTRDPKVLAIKQELELKRLSNIQNELTQIESKLRQGQLEAYMLTDPVTLPAFTAGTIGILSSSAQGPLLTASGLFPGRPHQTSRIGVSEVSIEERLRNDPEYNRLAKYVSQQEQKLARLKSDAVNPEKEPQFRTLVEGIELAKKELAARRDALRPSIVLELRAKILSDVDASRATAQGRVDFMQRLKEVLQHEFEEHLTKHKDTNRKAADLEWLKEEIGLVEDTVKRSAVQVNNLEIEIDYRKFRVTKDGLGPAEFYEDGHTGFKKASMGFFGAFAFVICAVTYLEFRSRKVNSAEDLVDGLQIKLMGTMPVMSRRSTGKKGAAASRKNRQLHSHMLESVDATRLLILHTARSESMQVLMVTSAYGGEGKTMLSSHLAVSLASTGYRTLLIDGDLRRPTMHKVFNLPSTPGLSEVLRQEIDIDQVIRPGPVDGLALLTAGSCKNQPGQLLSQASIGPLLETFRQQYDYIILDSAPVLPVADSQLLGQHADGVVLSVLRDVSRLPSVHAAYTRLSMLHIRILGAVIHGTPSNSYYLHYSYESTAETTTKAGVDS
jgi:succinoglycan biosynthesis transport protein ExoP